MEILVVIGLLVGIAAMVYFMLLQKPKCPSCGRARVPGHRQCPYCSALYRPTSKPIQTPSERFPTPSAPNIPLLICLQGPQSGQEFPLTAREFTIGRSADNMLRVEGMLVSRYHAQISFRDGQYVLYDRESTNGTYVNGQRIAHHVLTPGDQIQIGPSVFAFQMQGATPPQLISPPPTPRPAVTPSPPPRVEALDDYALTTISRGGMATVYKGISRHDRSTVAIKIFHHTDSYLQSKFEQEGRVGRTLNHPHIARILDYGSKDGTLYIVMEYVDNGSLRDRLQPGQPLPLDFVTSVIGQTCEALSYAHGQGVIHRDIKPENIMFSSQEGVKIVDFGIAKFAREPTRTSAGMIIGTPYYMSYEQAKGQPVDSTSDIYSLGVVLYEMVTGRVPFAGKPLDVVSKHLTEKPTPPRRINSALSPQVETVVMRALEKDRNRRFQTAAEMARVLGYTVAVPSPAPYVYERPEEKAPRVEVRRRRFEPEPAAVSVQLAVVGGTGIGKRIPITPPITILRRRDIAPNDLLVSREHARIIQQGRQFWLEDLGSMNGTYLNGRRIFERALLQNGDEIRVGNNVLRFEG